MKRIGHVLLLGLLISTASARSISGYVERIYPTIDAGGNHVVNFRIKGDDCKRTGSDGNTYWRFNLDGEVKEAWFSMLLAASVSGKIIKVGIPVCEPSQDQYINYIFQDY